MTTLPEPTATTAQVLETALDALAKAVSAGIGDHVAKGCLAGLARTWRAYDQWFDDLPQDDENQALPRQTRRASGEAA